MTNNYEVTFPGGKITFMERKWSAHTRSSEMSAAPRMYVSVTDETIMDNLANRKRRPYNVYKTLIHSSGLNKVLNLSKLSWSQHAGCTCNCSPGFILNWQPVTVDGKTLYKWDAWVTLESAPAVDETKPARVLVGL